MADGLEPQDVDEASTEAVASSDGPEKKTAHRSFREIMRWGEPEFRYGELLALLIITFIFNGSITRQTRWHDFVLVLLESLTLLVALRASRANRFTVRVSAVVCGVALLSSILQLVFDLTVFRSSTAVLSVVLVVVGPIAVIKGVLRRRVVDARTVLAALSLYVMFGMLFSAVFAACQAVTDHQFFVQTRHGSPSDFSYFSFITLTTVGYGDLTAATATGRTLAAFEAMFGQLYLVSIVAVLVSNLGPIFSSRRDDDGDDEDDVGGTGTSAGDATSAHG